MRQVKTDRSEHGVPTPYATRAACLALGLMTALAPRAAAAADFILNIEPAAAFWLDGPQSDHFATGFYGAVRPGVSLGRVVALQASYAMLQAPAGEGRSIEGSVHELSAGLRLRPFGATRSHSEQLGGLFMDLNVGYVRTGNLDRAGFDAGLGYVFQVAPRVGIGPVLRYNQVLQRDDIQNRDPNDAQFVTAGLNLSFGAVHDDQQAASPAPAPACPPATVCPAAPVDTVLPVVWPCADQDHDGLCDADDRCPTAIGPLATLGCPIDPCSGAPLVVLVQFGYDSAGMPEARQGATQTMDPVLDAVASAIEQDPSCRVCIMGYASEEGGADYNLELSQRRATAVQGYMTARGLARSRIPTIGLGERCQIVPEASLLLNRRVEFHRLQEGESCPVACAE